MAVGTLAAAPCRGSVNNHDFRPELFTRTTYQTMKPPEEIKGDLIGEKGVHSRDDGHPDRPGNKDQPLAIYVCDTAPEKEKASESKRVG